jgi:hypothetical protein
MKLTKSLFLSYLESPLHMWLSVHSDTQPKPPSLYGQHTMKQGYSVEKLAKEFLQRKVNTQYPAGTTLTFEATLTDGNYESRIDALVHDTVHNTYDLYEIKSSTTIHTEHKYDVTFQYLVGKATLPINKVYLVRVNSDYQRSGEIDINELFIVEAMTDHIAKKEDEVYQLRSEAWGVLRLEQEPIDEHCFNPGTCLYPNHCFSNLPEYSIYDLGRASKKQYRELIDMGVGLVKNIPDTFTQNFKQRLQIQSARTGQPIIDHEGIKHELNKLEFPLYFLDYETYGEALPLYDGYKPYQQAVTQFSIHVARSPDSDEFEHYECLATEPGDSSKQLATELCSIIGETGTVIVWNKGFECGRNEELSVLCPEFCDQLMSINQRTYDLMEIFSLGLYVDYRFHGSASIKKVLPVLCPELSYKELDINEGTKAMLQWHEMVYGNLSESEKEKIRFDLLTYCKLDTWAMVEIWRKLKNN